MTDRYLFRGISKRTNKWVYGHLLKGPGDNVYIVQNFAVEQTSDGDCDLYATDFEWVYPETFGQWTGLVDKNGVRIFEGDNVKFENSTAIVEWYETEFIAMCRIETHTAYDCAGNLLIGGECIVTGSIHDHLLHQGVQEKKLGSIIVYSGNGTEPGQAVRIDNVDLRDIQH